MSLAAQVLEKLRGRGQMLVTAESCTGGLVAASLTSISGSSEFVWGGFVTYDNTAKTAMIGVPEALLAPGGPGAVSEEVARAMAEGALKTSGAAVAIAVTGIAGPGGGTEGKPVGLVHFAYADAGKTVHLRKEFGDIGRQNVREETVKTALGMVLDGLGVPRP
jgi:nicotinamide-nucleotide amidase